MMLRASVEAVGGTFDPRSVTEGASEAGADIPHAAALIAFAEAVVADQPEPLAEARRRIHDELGPAALVDASGVASNFERMVRIADATGIPLDPHLTDAARWRDRFEGKPGE